ncbi:MAG: hypothetical protein AAF909_13010, partial [Pseudomonadota bacterium]
LARLSLNLGDHCDLDEDGAITFTFDEGRELSLFHVEETGQLVCEIEIALVRLAKVMADGPGASVT